VLLATIVLATGWVAWVAYRLGEPHADWEGEAVVVELPRGMDAASMLERLNEAGVVRHPTLLRVWLAVRGGATGLKAGEYRFDRPVSDLSALDKLQRGEVLLHPVTVPEGLDLEEVAGRLSDAGFGDRIRLLEAFRNASLVEDLDAEAADLEGYLYPDTYHLPGSETPSGITGAMTARFREVIGTDYTERARAVGLSVREAVTLASLIEKETSVPDERGRISRVFHNRLARGMRLQCDPTVIYALKRAGRPVALLSYRDLEFDSPWNTYKVEGLPPGPICSPGRASLEAATDPAEGNDLYFVASPGGGHTFSSDHRSHLKAVREWRRYQRSSR
jgi:UPF0755 protein